MEPSFCAGDHVLTYNWGKFIIGSVVVVKWNDKFQIKRVKRILGNEYTVSGDNKKLSANDRLVTEEEIVGRVFLKY